MGCDIHAQVDWDEYGDGQWQAQIWYGKLSLPRSYRMFGALMNGHARYPDDAFAPPERGAVEAWPESDRYDPDTGNMGDWGFSWITLTELDAAIARVEAEWPGSRMYEYRAVAEYMRELERSGNPTRFVFGFDS